MVLLPDTEELPQAESYQWSVYAQREYEALLTCSKIQGEDDKTL